MVDTVINKEVQFPGVGPVKVIRKIGEGGQGTVYLVELPSNIFQHRNPYAEEQGRKAALKISRMRDPGGDIQPWVQYVDRLENLASARAIEDPGLTLPLAVVTTEGLHRIIYLMNLAPESGFSLKSLMEGVAHPVSDGDEGPFPLFVEAGLQACRIFERLHRRATPLLMVDFNPGGVFINPKPPPNAPPGTGVVTFVDCDNISPQGLAPVFLLASTGAPELVRYVFGGGKAAECTTATDNWSLAVVSYYLMCLSDPFRGPCLAKEHPVEDNQMILDVYGSPRFIWADESQHFPPGTPERINWARLPGFFRKAFTKTFTEGAMNPAHRLTASQWSSMWMALRDSLVKCPKCGFVTPYDFDRAISTRQTTVCGRVLFKGSRVKDRCGFPLPAPPYLSIARGEARRRIALRNGAIITPRHLWLDSGNKPDRFSPLAEFREVAGGGFSVTNCTRNAFGLDSDDGRYRVEPAAPGQPKRGVSLEGAKGLHFHSSLRCEFRNMP